MTAPADDLEDRLAAVVGQLNALHAQLVDLVAEAKATNAWAGAGIRSLTHWLTWKAGMSNPHAAHLVRLADAKGTHPQLSSLFASGQLTVDQAAVAVKVPPHHDRRVAEMAPLATVNQLHTIVRCAQPVSPKATETPPDTVTSWTTDDGRWHLRADLSPDRGRVVDAALRAARDRLVRAGTGRVTTLDALLDVARRSIDAESPARRERFRVNLFLDTTASWQDGTTMPDAIRRHLTCDGTISPTFVAAGRPVSVGPAQRIVPDRTRRLVLHRDHDRCRVPWCGSTAGLEVHHVVHWEHDQRTDLDNLVALCGRCHRAHHHGDLGITGNPDDPDGLVFTDVRDRILTGQPRALPPSGPAPNPDHPYEHPLGERLDTRSVGAVLTDHAA